MQADAALLSSSHPTNKNSSECCLWIQGCESARPTRHLFGRESLCDCCLSPLFLPWRYILSVISQRVPDSLCPPLTMADWRNTAVVTAEDGSLAFFPRSHLPIISRPVGTSSQTLATSTTPSK